MKFTNTLSKNSFDFVILAVAILAISTSGSLITITAAPALAIAFWRCLIGAVATAPFAFKSGIYILKVGTEYGTVQSPFIIE